MLDAAATTGKESERPLAHGPPALLTPSPRLKKRARGNADARSDEVDTKPKQHQDELVEKLIKQGGCLEGGSRRSSPSTSATESPFNGQATLEAEGKMEAISPQERGDQKVQGAKCQGTNDILMPEAVKDEDDAAGANSKASPSKVVRGHGRAIAYNLPPPQEELEDKLDVRVGAKCTAFDARDQKWYKSAIVEIKGPRAKIHYDGWGDKYDAWVEISLLKPPVKKPVLAPLPKPVALKCVATSTTSVTLELSMPSDAAKVHEFRVQVDEIDDQFKVKIFSFNEASSTYSFEYKGLNPDTEYDIAVKAFARAWLWSDYSDVVQVTTEAKEEEGDIIESGAGRSAKARADQKSKKQAALLSGKKEDKELSAEELKMRAEKNKTKHHDYHCDLCLGWEGKLICCDGVCKRSFHHECVGLDPDDADLDKWICDNCQMGRVRCFVCLDNVSEEDAMSCSRETCKKSFHPACLAADLKKPLSEVLDMKAQGTKFLCRRHQCQGCGKGQGEYTGKQGNMIRCIRCPLSYHFKCIPSHGYVEYPEPVPNFICDKHTFEVRKFKQLQVMSALRESKIEEFDTSNVSEPIIKQLMDNLQLTLPGSFRVPARFAEARNYQGNKPEAFKLLRSNLYTMGKPKITKQDIQVCGCKATSRSVSACLPVSVADAVAKNGGGTCGDDCENRQTMFECMSSVCHADCQNQRLQKRQYPRLELFKTVDGRGWGLRALEDIPKGSLVQEYIGEVLTTEAFRSRAASYGPNKPVYFFNINSEMVIDASAMGSMARFINHSCGPNCHTEKWSVGAETRIAIVASDAIAKGSEVTYNYEFESFGTMQHKCMCGAPNCSGFLGKRPKSEKEVEREEKERLLKKKRKSKADLLKESQEAENAAAVEARQREEKEKQDHKDALLGSCMVLKDDGARGGLASKNALTVLTELDDSVLVLTAAQLLEWYLLSDLEPAPSVSPEAAEPTKAMAGVAAKEMSTIGARGVENQEKRKQNRTFLITRFTSDKIEQLQGESGQGSTCLKISPNVGSLPHDYLEQICAVLEESTSIDSVDLDNCGIGDEGCGVIRRLLLSNKFLVSISLQFCNISDKGLQQLLRAFLEGGPSVSSLILNQNSITDASFEQLVEVQKRYPTLLVGLKGNSKLSGENLKKIQKWHVHNAPELYRAALLHRQKYVSAHETTGDGPQHANEQSDQKTGSEKMPTGDEKIKEEEEDEGKPLEHKAAVQGCQGVEASTSGKEPDLL